MSAARDRARGSHDREISAGRIARAGRGAGSLLYTLLVLAAVFLTLALSQRFRYQWDLSRDRSNVLAPQTQAALRGLAEDVELNALFTAKEPRRESYLYLLMRYETASPHVKVRFVDPVAKPGVVKDLGVNLQEEGQRHDGITVAVRGNRKLAFSGVEEEDVTNAILEVGSGAKRVVGLIRGYGEHDAASTGADGLSKAAEALRQEYYEIRDVTLAEPIPPDVTVLVAAGPVLPVPGPGLERLAAWLDRGGRFLALLDPGSGSGLERVLEKWGLKASGRQILDPKDNMNRQFEFLRISRYTNHPIVRGFGKNFPTAFPMAQAVEHFEPGDPKVFHDDLARTSDFAVAQAQDGTRSQGPFSVAVASWKRHSGADVEAETRVVLVGDSDFATNLYLPAQANRNFFLNCMGWLSREQGLVSIRQQPMAHQTFDLSPGDRQTIVLAVFAAPFLVVLAGIIVVLRRRSL